MFSMTSLRKLRGHYRGLDAARGPRRGQRTNRGLRRFLVETLEDRVLLAVSSVGLDYSTFLGGQDQWGSAVDVDSSGVAYIAGNAFQKSPCTIDCGKQDVGFVAALDPGKNGAGDLVWGTTLDGDHAVKAIALDPTEQFVYAADVHVERGGPNGIHVTKLDAATGQHLVGPILIPLGDLLVHVHETLGPLSGLDILAVDSGGNVYVTGTAPVTDVSGNVIDYDVLIAKLTADLELLYQTSFGSSAEDVGKSIAVDSFGNPYVTGTTAGADFDLGSGGTFDTSYNNDDGGTDIFVAKLDPTDGQVVAATYVGGSSNDVGNGIALDSQNNVYLGGWTESISGISDFPVTGGAYDESFNFDPSISFATRDGVVARLSPDLSTLDYATFLGERAGVFGITVDAEGNATVSGNTASSTFPTVNPINDTEIPYNGSTFSGASDVFVARLHPSGLGDADLLFSTYLGGSSGDGQPVGIALNATGDVYIAGHSGSNDFPVTPGAFDTGFDGNGHPNYYLSKLSFGPPAPGITVTPTAGLVTTEAGGTDSFTIVLDAAPTGSVTIALSSSNTGEGTVSPSSVTFTTTDWDTPKVVTVTGVDDMVQDGDTGYTIVTGPASSSDPNYSGRNAADVSVTNLDDDGPVATNIIYVNAISFESKRHGKDWRAVVQIFEDTDGDGQASAGDSGIAGVSITVEFVGMTFSGTTDSNGVYRTGWVNNVPSGTHYANVVNLMLDGFVWNPLALDREDDSDGDGNPDDVSII